MTSEAFARAQQLHASGELEAAASLYEQCLREAPDDWRALTRLGLVRVQQRRYAHARPLLERAAALNPANPEAHTWLGEALRNEGRLDGAAACFREALRIQPAFPPAWFNLGLTLQESWDVAAARDAFTQFLALRPADPRVRRELAKIASGAGDVEQAIGWLRQHVESFPGDASAQYELAEAFEALAHLPSAIACYERVAALAPGRADIHNALAVAHHNLAQHEQALAEYRKALELRPDFAEVHSNLLVALHYVDPDDCEAMFREHLAWAERHTAAFTARPREQFTSRRDPGRRLRVGYVSPRLSAGPVAHNFLPLIRSHDHERFHVTCYATHDAQDAVTDEVRSHADAWREAWPLDDAALLALIRDDEIDILVDLSGHCPGHKLRVFAQRGAPIQMTWLDYSNTTGVAAIDYFVGDRLQTPLGTAQRYTEELVRLPHTRLCYRPRDDLPPVSAPPATRNGFVTFGCINRLSKLNAASIAVWSRILRAVPGSRLLLKGTAYASGEIRQSVAGRFAQDGIGADRLDLRGYSDEAQMMAEYGDIDICLDPFPYNGSTTTCDALTMGVPVVTLSGESIASRAGLMFLAACGLEEWIARTPEDYVRIASEAAQDVGSLTLLRQGLRERFLASPACDSPAFARAFEGILRAAWVRFVAEGR